MSSRRAMSERQRVLLALQGKRFPCNGDLGLFTRLSKGTTYHARVEVVRVSPTGQTIWTRFVSDVAQQLWGAGPHRWWRVPDDDSYRKNVDELLYAAGRESKRAPYGDINFPESFPEGTL